MTSKVCTCGGLDIMGIGGTCPDCGKPWREPGKPGRPKPEQPQAAGFPDSIKGEAAEQGARAAGGNMDQNDMGRAGLLDLNDPAADTDLVETPPAPGEALEAAAPAAGLLAKAGLGDLWGDAVDRLEARASGKETPIRTPWETVNGKLGGGLWPGLVVLTGNTGTGKTQWALQLVLGAAKAGHPVVYVGLELDRLGLVARLAAMETRETTPPPWPNWSDLYLGQNPKARELLEGLRPGLSGLPLYLVEGDPGLWNPGEQAALVKAAAKAHPGKTPLLVLDFLQLVGTDRDPDGREARELREKIGKAAYAGRKVARDLGAVVIQLSSTARDNYRALAGIKTKQGGDEVEATPPLGEGDAGRLVGMGKESGEIEFAADLALVLCRKRWPKGEPPPPVFLAIAKVRAGRTGWAKLGFDGTLFDDQGDPEPGNPAGELLAKAGKEGGGGGRFDE